MLLSIKYLNLATRRKHLYDMDDHGPDIIRILGGVNSILKSIIAAGDLSNEQMSALFSPIWNPYHCHRKHINQDEPPHPKPGVRSVSSVPHSNFMLISASFLLTQLQIRFQEHFISFRRIRAHSQGMLNHNSHTNTGAVPPHFRKALESIRILTIQTREYPQ